MSFNPVAEGDKIKFRAFMPSFQVIDQNIKDYFAYLKFTPMELKEIIPNRLIRAIDITKRPKVVWNFFGRENGDKTYATVRLMRQN